MCLTVFILNSFSTVHYFKHSNYNNIITIVFWSQLCERHPCMEVMTTYNTVIIYFIVLNNGTIHILNFPNCNVI